MSSSSVQRLQETGRKQRFWCLATTLAVRLLLETNVKKIGFSDYIGAPAHHRTNCHTFGGSGNYKIVCERAWTKSEKSFVTLNLFAKRRVLKSIGRCLEHVTPPYMPLLVMDFVQKAIWCMNG
jgi:hypothetical protein